MKKTPIALGLVGVLAVAYVGSSWYIGTRLETLTDQQIVRINTRLAAELAANGVSEPPVISKLSYDRGIFSSEARYRIGMPDSDEAIVLHDTIGHGPLPWVAIQRGDFVPGLAFSEVTLDKDDKVSTELRKFFGDTEPLVARTRVGFGKSVAVDWRINAFKHEADDVKVDFGGLKLVGSASNDWRTWDAKGDSPSLLIEDKTGYNPVRISYSSVDFYAKTVNGEFDIGIGDSGIVLNDLLVVDPTDAEGKSFSIKKTEVTSNVKPEGKTAFNVNVTYKIDDIKVKDQSFGDISLTADVKQLDGAALQGLNQAYEKLVESGELAKLRDPMAILSYPSISDNLIGLLKQSPQLLISLDARNAGGASNAKLTLETAPPADPKQVGPEVIRRIHGTLDLNKAMAVDAVQRIRIIDGIAAEQAKTEADELVTMGLGEGVESGGLSLADNGNYTSYITYENGKLVLNGEEIPPFMIPLLLGLLGSGMDYGNTPDADGFNPDLLGVDPEGEEFLFEEEQVIPSPAPAPAP